MIDPVSVAAAPLRPDEQTDLLVVGAGPAGLAAAIEAARLGLSVVLADENPVPAATMGGDVPLHFGGRAGGAVRNRNAMMEAFLDSDPAIAEAFEAGVDVRLGTSVLGIYGRSKSVAWLPDAVAMLSDGERSMMLGAARIIVAAGRRDAGLAFDGWQAPGVLGMTAAVRLATRYRALDVHRAIVLGTSADALLGAGALRDAGVEIAAFVEVSAAPMAPDALRAGFAATPFLCGHALRRVETGTDGVTAAVVTPLVGEGAQTLACDAIILAVAAVPLIELLAARGCRTQFDATRGGHVPVLNGAQRASIPEVYAVGDCAGIFPAKSADPEIARAEGRRAARDAAATLGRTDAAPEPASLPPDGTADAAGRFLDWVRAHALAASEATYVCQCEEVTAREILEVRPPRYLDVPDGQRTRHDLAALLGASPPSPDQVKRLTRAGMGLCQGRRCREQVAALLALGSGSGWQDIPLATYRAPVRPVPLSLAAATPDPAMAQHWDTWFGMPSQYQPFWEIDRPYTAAGRPKSHNVAS